MSRGTKVDLMSVSPHSLLKCVEIKFGATPVKITIGAKKFAISLNYATRFDRDVQPLLVYVPLRIFEFFVQRVVDVTGCAYYSFGVWVPGVSDDSSLDDGIVRGVGVRGYCLDREMFSSEVLTDEG